MRPLDLNLIASIRDEIRALDADDDSLLADMIEGETDAMELMDMLLDAEAEATELAAAVKARAETLAQRQKRFQDRAAAIKVQMNRLMDATGLRKMERPAGTVSLRRVPPKLIGDDITSLPESCVVTTYRPDRKAIKEAIEAGETFEGWSLDNGGETISIRRG